MAFEGAFELELPGVYADALVADAAPGRIVLINRDPDPSETGVPLGSNVVLELTDTGADGIAVAATQVWIDGVLAFSAGVFQAGFTGPGSASTAPATDTRRIVIDPLVDFASLHVATVRVVSATNGATAAIDATYTFTCADLSPPRLLSAQARELERVRLVFDESVVMGDHAGSADALNPANYVIQRLMTDPTIPAVQAVAVAVEAVNDKTVDVLLNIPLSQGQPYNVVLSNITDIFGNAIAGPYNNAQFLAYRDPAPSRRRFTLWEMIPKINRQEDVTRDLWRFVGVAQEVTDLLLAGIDHYTDQFDPLIAAEASVDAMLVDLADPFAFDLSLADKRRLVSVLVEMYQQKGTALGIINVVRFFLGLEVRVVAGLEGSWILGVSLLGTTTVLAPSGGRPRYTFDVIAPRILTDAERDRVRQIANFMKNANEHLGRIVEPTTPGIPSHWEIGVSELGVTTFLH